MTGTHFIEIHTPKLKYSLILNRNITILQGNSGTGKTTLYTLFSNRNKTRNSVLIKSSCRVVALSDDIDLLKEDIDEDVIFIADEDVPYLNTKRFAKFVKRSGKYFLLITRTPLRELPYSIKSIYRLNTELCGDKFVTSNKELFFSNDVYTFETGTIITEDSGSGRTMFERVYNYDKYKVYSGKLSGNSSVEEITKNIDDKCLVIVDGAAFGSYISKMVNILRDKGDGSFIWAPESFEYLIFKAGILYNDYIKDIMKSPGSYIDSSKYLSWEEYFFDLLVSECRKSGLNYGKNYLPDRFLSESNINKFINILPDVIKPNI